MTRPCAYLWNLCGALIVLASAALAQDATGPQPVAIDFTFPVDAARPVGNASIGVHTTSAAPLNDAEAAYGNPIPQFVRDMFAGRDLPSVSAGHKVVTVPVSVENWLLLNWGDKVRVQLIEAHSNGDRNGVDGTDSQKTLHCIQEAQVYALPNFAPEAGDEVPICLELVSSDARRLISLRGKGRFILTVVHSAGWPVYVAADPVQPVPKAENSTEIELASLLQRLYPQASIEVISVRDSVIVRGTVTEAEHLTQISEIAAQFAPTVLDQLKVAAASSLGATDDADLPAQDRSADEDVSRPAGDLQQIRDELRALHDDVRRLIEILEQRNKEKSGATTQEGPAPAAAAPAKDKLVGLYFMADWCGPCQKLTPIVDRLREQHGCRVRTINVDTEPGLSEIFSIHSLPTVVILDDGREVDRIVGVTTEDRLKQAFSVAAASSHSTSAIRDLPWDMLGLKLFPASPDRIGEPGRYRGGLEVIDVRPDSPAARQSIRAGDILVGLHVWETTSLENVEFVLRHAEFATFVPLKFYLVRDHETLYGTLDLNAVPATSRIDQSPTPAVEFIGQPAGIEIKAPNALVPAGLPTY